MSEVPPASSGGGADAAIAKMEATFNMAIEKSAKITELTTAKKAASPFQLSKAVFKQDWQAVKRRIQ